MVDIVGVANKRDLETFIRLPGRLAANDPAWVEPLWFERRQFLSPTHNPFFKHADVRLWVAYKNGEPAGRISAQIDHLAPSQDGQKLGFFGLIDAAFDDVLAALFASAEGWLLEQGADIARGPFSLSVNETAGLLIEGFDTPPYVMMDHHGPWLGPAIERQNYRKARDLVTYTLDVSNGLPDHPRRLAERAFDGLLIRSLDMARYGEEIITVTSIFNDAWADNWGFIPLTEAEIDAMASELKPILDPELVKIAELNGKPVAFIVLLPNLNEAISDLGGRLLPFGWLRLIWRLKVSGVRTARVPLMGVRKDISDTMIGKMLPLKLIYALEKRSMARKIRELEMSWLLEDNWPVRRVIESISGKLSKTYRIYEKGLR